MLWASRLRPSGTGLFPEAPRDRPARRTYAAAVQAAAVAGLAVLLLFRVTGVHAWNCLYAEDAGIFLVHALAHPWHLLAAYNGYLQLVPRMLAQAVSMLPLAWAAFAFAVAGALIAAGCALFTYHASAGYIGSSALRAVLALTLILLPVAPLELADNGVNTSWYLLVALFWAVLWRPRSRAGKGASALVAAAAVSTSPLAILFAPLLAIRVCALRPVREHAVTIGWLLGWPLQAYAIVQSYAQHTQRLGTLAPLGGSIAYYLHTVVLRAFGWHVSWGLVRNLGQTGATVLCGVVLLALLGCAAAASRRAAVFAVLAVVSGLVFTVLAAAITGYVVRQAPLLTPVSFEPGSRYSALPLMLIYAALISGADAFARRQGGLREACGAALHGVLPAAARGRLREVLRGPRSRPVAAAAVAASLVCLLAVGWVTDYRYPTQRTTNGPWAPVASRWLDRCRHSETILLPEWTGRARLTHVRVPCSRLVA